MSAPDFVIETDQEMTQDQIEALQRAWRLGGTIVLPPGSHVRYIGGTPVSMVSEPLETAPDWPMRILYCAVTAEVLLVLVAVVLFILTVIR